MWGQLKPSSQSLMKFSALHRFCFAYTHHFYGAGDAPKKLSWAEREWNKDFPQRPLILKLFLVHATHTCAHNYTWHPGYWIFSNWHGLGIPGNDPRKLVGAENKSNNIYTHVTNFLTSNMNRSPVSKYERVIWPSSYVTFHSHKATTTPNFSLLHTADPG